MRRYVWLVAGSLCALGACGGGGADGGADTPTPPPTPTTPKSACASFYAADFALWDIARPADLSYAMGLNPCVATVCGGQVHAVD